jgi:hypothetical protein
MADVVDLDKNRAGLLDTHGLRSEELSQGVQSIR